MTLDLNSSFFSCGLNTIKALHFPLRAALPPSAKYNQLFRWKHLHNLAIAKAIHIASVIKILTPVNIAAKSFCHSAVRSSINFALLKIGWRQIRLCISSGPSSLVVAVLFSSESFLSRKCFHIYHNIHYRLPPEKALRAFLTETGKTDDKPHRSPPETRRLCFYGVHGGMRTNCIARKFTPFSLGESPVPAFFHRKQ